MKNIKPLDSSALQNVIDKFSPFLNEVKKRIIVTVGVFIAATFIGFVFYEQVIKFLIDILSLKGINIVFTSPFQFINLAISVGIASGLIFSVPFLVAQILFFLRPALKKKEFRMIIWFLPFSVALFLIGFLFGFLIMKWQIQIFLSRSVALGIGNILDISSLLTVVLYTSAFMGLGFQFPVILLLLMRVGLIKHQQLSKQRPWVYLGSFIFAVLLPPDSILADILLSLPLIILFELTLLLNRILEKSKAGKAILEGT